MYDRIIVNAPLFLFGIMVQDVIDLHNIAAPFLLQSLKLLYLPLIIPIGRTAALLLRLLTIIVVFVHPETPTVFVAVLQGHVIIFLQRQGFIIPKRIAFQEYLKRATDIGHGRKRSSLPCDVSLP